MKFNLFKASDPDFYETIQLNSIEELVNFIHEVNSELIIGVNINGVPSLTIYDDYIE